MVSTSIIRFSRLGSLWVLVLLCLQSAGLYAQTQVDASFGPMQIYQPATVQQVLQLSTGERLVLGSNLVRADGISTTQRLVRYSATGAPDATFAVNIADYAWSPQGLADAGGGRVLVTLAGPATLNNQLHYSLVRLLPSGLVDPGFAVQPNLSALSSVQVQPDGKIVVAGNFQSYAGLAASNLLRLNDNGTPDQAFIANTAGGLMGSTFRPVLALQPDGKLVVGGTFRTAAGQPRSGLARFNADGTLDVTFAPSTTSNALVGAVAVQPDGRILAATFNGTYLVPGVSRTLVRFSASGAHDNTFVTGSFGVRPAFSGGASTLLVQPDGKILAAFSSGLVPPGNILRLTTSGAIDPTWVIATLPANSSFVSSLQLLAGGQVLFGGAPQLTVSTTAVPVGMAQLTSTGALDTTFPLPTLQAAGVVNDLAQQPDGKLVVAGTFTEINGSAARGLARLNTDGSVDTPYTAACAITQGYPTKLVLQPDGKALVGGRFSGLGGVAVPSLGRVLATGTPDPAFVPALYATAISNLNSISSLAVQPDGAVLVGGSLRQGTAVAFAPFLRLSGGGAADNSFQPPVGLVPTAVLVQPDGRIVVGNNDRTTSPVQRLMPSGSPDATFVSIAPPSASQLFSINGLRRYPDGRFLVFGVFDELGGQTTRSVARLSATGALDPTFSANLPGSTDIIYAVAIQPNGRIMVGGALLDAAGLEDLTLARLQPDGSRDLSLDETVNPVGTVYALEVQPNGALLVGGQFAKVGTQMHFGLIRLLDANVLRLNASQPAPNTEAWPIPTHNQLHLRLDVASRPERVELRDAVGRLVVGRNVSVADVSLDLTAVPAGIYLLQVQYAAGRTYTRRVVRE